MRLTFLQLRLHHYLFTKCPWISSDGHLCSYLIFNFQLEYIVWWKAEVCATKTFQNDVLSVWQYIFMYNRFIWNWCNKTMRFRDTVWIKAKRSIGKWKNPDWIIYTEILNRYRRTLYEIGLYVCVLVCKRPTTVVKLSVLKGKTIY